MEQQLSRTQPISINLPLPSPMTLLVKKITVHCRSSCCLQDNAPSRFVALGQPGIGGYYIYQTGFLKRHHLDDMVLRECQLSTHLSCSQGEIEHQKQNLRSTGNLLNFNTNHKSKRLDSEHTCTETSWPSL